MASYVSRLRKALAAATGDGPPVVLTRAPGYVLAVDPADVDLSEFETLLAEGRRAFGIGQPALAAVRLRQALALWCGDAYADVGEAAFAPGEARRLAELRLAAIESRVEAELAAAAPVAPPTLASELQLLVADHPHRERLWTLLITCLYRQGQQADALATYQRARERLVEDLGVEPGSELRAAELAVLSGDPGLTGRPMPPSPVPPELPGPCRAALAGTRSSPSSRRPLTTRRPAMDRRGCSSVEPGTARPGSSRNWPTARPVVACPSATVPRPRRWKRSSPTGTG